MRRRRRSDVSSPAVALDRIKELAKRGYDISVEEVQELITLLSRFTFRYLIEAGFPRRAVRAICTKFRDAGRRSPPWRPTSGRVPGRPQDGADGNRRNRWLFDHTHKFYADEVTATLCEVRYYLQLLSMKNAPLLPEGTIQDSFAWLIGHRIVPGEYLDPIQLIPGDLKEFAANPRSIESGHLIPLDRGGRHEPRNAFLVLRSSNTLQGDRTLDELLALMGQILHRHGERENTLTH